ncbi:hypothetical protein C8J56DRAFT_1020998 [Mycena floridula]|nr:hypothetical protein C8J56DRAFT_1020998 [Mycena floridula]
MPRIFSIDFSSVSSSPLGAHRLPGYPLCSFSNKDYEPPATLPDKIKLESIIHIGDQTFVYGASGNAAGQGEPVSLVVKFAPLRTLERESSAYNQLDECLLSGQVSPLFFGMLWASPLKDPDDYSDSGPLGCIITERWGSSVKTELYYLAKADKAVILNKLSAIHDIGILHYKIEPQTVLRKDGDFRIINFSRAKFNHECSLRGGRYNFAEVGEYLSKEDTDNICSFVWSVASDMRLWERGLIFIVGRSYKKSVYSLPSQHEIYTLPLPQNHRYDPDLYDEWNLEFYLEVRRQRDNGLTLEELKSDENMAKLVDAADVAIELIRSP